MGNPGPPPARRGQGGARRLDRFRHKGENAARGGAGHGLPRGDRRHLARDQHLRGRAHGAHALPRLSVRARRGDPGPLPGDRDRARRHDLGGPHARLRARAHRLRGRRALRDHLRGCVRSCSGRARGPAAGRGPARRAPAGAPRRGRGGGRGRRRCGRAGGRKGRARAADPHRRDIRLPCQHQSRDGGPGHGSYRLRHLPPYRYGRAGGRGGARARAAHDGRLAAGPRAPQGTGPDSAPGPGDGRHAHEGDLHRPAPDRGRPRHPVRLGRHGLSVRRCDPARRIRPGLRRGWWCGGSGRR